MRLFNQLVLMLSLFTTIIITTIMVQNFKSATEFVQNQLYTDSVNTSHWLAMSLSMIPNPADLAVMKSMIDAVFDSGYYEKIALVDTKGNVLYARHNDVRVHDVPNWFVEEVTIKNETMSSDIVINWKRFGELQVYGHRGHAYQQLYSTLLDLINTFIWVGIAGFIVLYVLLSYSLSALNRIRNQAKAVIDNQFIIEKKLPFTVELRSVAIAMNAMVKKVKDIFDRENELLRQYHELLYKDTETKIHNRRYLTAKLPDYLHAETNSAGVYAMFSFDGLERFKKEYGYHIYTRFITQFVDDVVFAFQKIHNTLVIRLNENDFIVIAPSAYLLNIGQLTEKVMVKSSDNMNNLDEELKKYLIIGCSIGNYTSNDTPKSLLSRADQAVTFAKCQENFFTHTDQTNEDNSIMGREEWRQELLDAIQESRILLAFQPVVEMVEGKMHVLHEEIWLRFKKKNGDILNTAYFLPIATTLGLADTLDRYMIEKVLKYLKNNKTSNAIAINLNGDFVKDYSNREWLRKQLVALKQSHNTKLWFEISNSVVIHHLEAVQIIFSMIKTLGYRVGVDHFVLPEDGAEYLRIIRPDYIKANATYLYDILYDANTGKARGNFTNLVDSVGIEIVATNVEENVQMDDLKKMGISRFQGSIIAPSIIK